jgi:hypothetical protein
VEKALLPYDLAPALAGPADFRGASLCGSGALAGFAHAVFLKDDFFFFAMEGFLQGYFNVVPEASSLGRTASAAPPRSEAEKVFKNIAEA